MFDLLKKKIGGFAEKILGSAEKKTSETAPAPRAPEPVHTVSETSAAAPSRSIPVQESPTPTEEKKIDILVAESESEDQEEIIHIREEAPKILPKMVQPAEREIKANVGIFQRVGGLITGTLTLSEDMVEKFLEEFELSLLEADVEFDTATALIEKLRERLANRTISSREDPSKVILSEIKHALHDIVNVEPRDLDADVNAHHPAIILILGPNGAGKTTTIAKLAHRYTKMGKKVVLASADTFRAGSIEQLNVHAQRIGVRMVKHQYGADPAAVAFDAVQAAKAEGADVVLIDSAGRQDTNKNLLEELKKIQRVIQPHVKIYVGESYTGQAILTQAQTFDETIGIDGFILTKLDTDTKGGGVISILHNLKKPILFFGVGQEYEDLIPFSMDEFLNRLIPTEEKQ